jgi:hypothetical protein
VAWWSSSRRSRGELHAGFDPSDLAELEAVFAAVDAEQVRQQGAEAAPVLRRLVSRGVPARAVEAAPDRGAVRIRFADGTQLLVRGSAPGDAGVLARWLSDRTVLLVTWLETEGEARLTFASPQRRGHLGFVVTGVDRRT